MSCGPDEPAPAPTPDPPPVIEVDKTAAKTVLDPEDDIAHMKWGGKWRIPTKEEWQKLTQICDKYWTATYYGKSGWIIKNRSTGNYIFLPAAGILNGLSWSSMGTQGYYWSSSLSPYGSDYAWGYNFEYGQGLYGRYKRFLGQSVRPISD